MTKAYSQKHVLAVLIFSLALLLLAPASAWAQTGSTELAAGSIAGSGALTTQAPEKEKSARTVDDGIYVVSTSLNVKATVAVANASTRTGANVELAADDGTLNEQWEFEYDEDKGFYTITNMKTKKLLAIDKNKAFSKANVVQQPKKSSLRGQYWSVEKVSGGYRIVSALNSKFALNVAGGVVKDAANINIVKASTIKSEVFALYNAYPDVEAKKTAENGAYTIQRSTSPQKAIDVSGCSQDNGASVVLWESTGGINQKWELKRTSGNFYTIVNVNSGAALDMASARRTPGSPVVQWKQNGTTNQLWSVVQNADGSYSFISKVNGLALTSEKNKTKNGTALVVSTFKGSSSQKFSLGTSAYITPGIYSLAARANVEKVFDVPGASTADGKQLIIYGYSGALNQKFSVSSVGDNVYTIQAGCSGKYLADSDGKLVQAAKSSSDSQKWKAVWKNTGITLQNVATGKAIDISSTSAKNNANLVTKAPSNAKTQRIVFQTRGVVDNGMYLVKSASSARLLEVSGSAVKNGANVDVAASTGGYNQKFEISAVSGGYYKLICVGSGKAVEAASKSNGANVRQNAFKGAAKQLWKAQISPNGGIVFVNKASGKALNVSGTNVVASKKDTSAASQRWTLAPTDTLTDVQRRALAKANARGSETNYFMAVDMTAHQLIIFKRENPKAPWHIEKQWAISTGRNGYTPAVDTKLKGYKRYTNPKPWEDGWSCYWWTSFYGGRWFHSVIYSPGTMHISDGRLGMSISNGCIRQNIDNAKWIYDNIPKNTYASSYY